jgi:uncharacterized membrane protein
MRALIAIFQCSHKAACNPKITSPLHFITWETVKAAMRELGQDRDRAEKVTSVLVAVLVVAAIGIYIYVAGAWNPLMHSVTDNNVPSPAIVHLPSHTPHPAPQ